MHCSKDMTQLIPASGKYRCPECKDEYDVNDPEVKKMLQLDQLREKIVANMLQRAEVMKKKGSKSELEKLNGMVNKLLSRYKEVEEGK